MLVERTFELGADLPLNMVKDLAHAAEDAQTPQKPCMEGRKDADTPGSINRLLEMEDHIKGHIRMVLPKGVADCKAEHMGMDST